MKAPSSGGAARVPGGSSLHSQRFAYFCLNVSRVWSSFSPALPPTFVESIKVNLLNFFFPF